MNIPNESYMPSKAPAELKKHNIWKNLTDGKFTNLTNINEMDKINENSDFEYNDDILAYLSREEP